MYMCVYLHSGYLYKYLFFLVQKWLSLAFLQRTLFPGAVIFKSVLVFSMLSSSVFLVVDPIKLLKALL